MQHRTRVKVCGITRLEDAMAAAGHGVDAVGFVFFEKSPRYIEPAGAATIIRRMPPFLSAVGLFVNHAQEDIDAILKACPVDVIQLHGEETPEFCAAQCRRVIKAVAVETQADLERVRQYDCSVLLDAKAPAGVYGGAGKAFDWALLDGLGHDHPLLLAGGLNAGNVAGAMRVRQWEALDVSSGVEISPGVKDAEKIAAFMATVHQASR